MYLINLDQQTRIQTICIIVIIVSEYLWRMTVNTQTFSQCALNNIATVTIAMQCLCQRIFHHLLKTPSSSKKQNNWQCKNVSLLLKRKFQLGLDIKSQLYGRCHWKSSTMFFFVFFCCCCFYIYILILIFSTSCCHWSEVYVTNKNNKCL